jgi:hypothetical protein
MSKKRQPFRRQAERRHDAKNFNATKSPEELHYTVPRPTMNARPTSCSLWDPLRRLLSVGLGVMAIAVSGQPKPGAKPTVWFPPDVPAFGEPIAPGMMRWQRDDAPSGLADFASERFYPALSSRLNAGSIGARLQARLDAFRSTRGALINELADQLVALHGADEETRRTELRAFAALQEPRIVAHEQEAEEIRRALIDGNVLQRSVDWSRGRKWFVGATRFRGEHAEKEAQFQVVRAAAYYQDGLTTEQRGLLLEEALDLQQRARAARPIPDPRRNDPAAMYFSPATARMRLPKHAPPELLQKVARFNQEKNALKGELREAVLMHDRTPREDRTAIFSTLADAQWPRIVELEKLADEIRHDMATLPVPVLAAAPHIPASLMTRIEDYNRDRQKFIDEFEQTMRAATALVKPRMEFTSSEDVRVQIARNLAADRAAMRAKVAKGFEEISRERFEEMRARHVGIQEDLALIAAGQTDPETGRPLTAETLLRSYSTAMERFNTFGREEVIYQGYRTAMLMPGLSAGQRRLLFSAAVIGLAQPLPPGETHPIDAHPVPRS